MQKPFIKLIVALFIILSASCNKNKKWKIPTEVKFKMDINHSEALGGALAWTSGNIMIANFTFEGKRVRGGDVYFTKTYPQGLTIFFDPHNTVSEWDFDIPQGTYTKIDISYKTYGNSDDNHILIKGTYLNTVNTIIYPVLFEFEAEEYYNIVAKTSSGSSEIVLSKDVSASVLIKADPVYWFQTVSTSMMNNATLTTVNGNPTIMISDTSNVDIYDAVKDRIDDDVTTVTFN